MKTRLILYADEGKILTDGTIYGRQIFLAEDRNPEEFYEVSEEVYEALMVAQAQEMEVE